MEKISLTLLMLVFILSSCAEVGSEQGELESTTISTSESTKTTSSKNDEKNTSKTTVSVDEDKSDEDELKNEYIVFMEIIGFKDNILSLELSNNSDFEAGISTEYELYRKSDKAKKGSEPGWMDIQSEMEFNSMYYLIDKGRTLIDNVDVEKMFGKLGDGEYLLVKEFYAKDKNISFGVDFNIKDGKIDLPDFKYDENSDKSISKSLAILDADSRVVQLSKEEENLLLKYVIEAMENNEKCERLKYIFPNQIVYVDEDASHHYFSFLAPALVEGYKESMLSVDTMNGDGYCVRIDRKFFELLKEIGKSKGFNFSSDA